MSDGATIAVVIVSYHTGPSLAACLDRVLAEPAVAEVALVDNGNDEATLAALRARAGAEPRLAILSGHGNVGFAAGCNRGARATTAPLLLLLNPDCLIEPGSLAALAAEMRGRPEPWVATVRLLEPSGAEQRGSRRNEGTPGQCLGEALRLPGLPRLNLNAAPLPPGPAAVPAISGAFMLMPRATFAALGGLDEGYFLHVEDLDFCRRLARAGGTAWFVPQLTATHVKGTSAASTVAIERHKIAGFRRFFDTHFAATWPWAARRLVWLMLSAGLLLRAVLR